MAKDLSEMTLEELWELFPIFLTEHKVEWQEQYNEMEQILKDKLSSYQDVCINHIGSTAIPSIWAKPIVDILVEIAKDENMDKVSQTIQECGFVQMSKSDTRISFCYGYTPNGFAKKVYHLHLRYIGDNDELYFRDYLNEHLEAAKEYEQLKMNLWQQYEHDRDGYTAAKTRLVEKYTAIAKTQLILLEGMPSTGKSTNAQKILIQLERNRRKAEWVHEVAMPQRVLFFDEMGFTIEEYKDFIKRFPKAASVLNEIAEFRESTVGINLNDIQWYHKEEISQEVIEALKAFDVWNFSVERYKKFALEKWTCFTKRALSSKGKVYVIDSAIFQYQIFTFLLQNRPFEEIHDFVNQIVEIIKPLNPILILLYRKNVEDTIEFLQKDRGPAELENMYQRDKDLPYYIGKPVGAKGYKSFLRDYDKWTHQLFDTISMQKKALDITEGNWTDLEKEMLCFLGLRQVPGMEVKPKDGRYVNKTFGYEIRIKDSYMLDPTGKKRQLIAKIAKEFYVEWLPVCLYFENQSIIISGSPILDQWTQTGLVYERMEKI